MKTRKNYHSADYHKKYWLRVKNDPCVVSARLHTLRKLRYEKFGITHEQYEMMLKMQKGLCKLCGRPPKRIRLAVEHDHGASKRVRGLCCYRCNRFLIGYHTLETARKLVRYLESDFDGRKL